MKKVYLDSSFLISYQIKGHPFQNQAADKLKTLNKETVLLCLSPLTIDEYLYGLSKYLAQGYFSNRNQIKNSLENILQLQPDFVQVNWQPKTPLEVYNLISEHSLKPRDAFHLKTMADHKIKHIATFDKDFEPLFKKNKIKKA